MSKNLSEAIDKWKHFYISKLVSLGVYKISDSSLYELTLTELISEYKDYKERESEIKNNHSEL